MNPIGDPGTTELGYALLLLGTVLLAIVFAIQTFLLSRRLRQHVAHSRQVEELAFFDPLTLLPNRRLLFDRLQRSLYASERHKYTTAIIFVDLDDFKEINDRFDYSEGDAVLTQLAENWDAALPATDTLARWGGDEFVVIREGIRSASDIQTVIDRLRDVCHSSVQLGDEDISLTISVGVAVGCEGSEDPEGLIRRADAAMYRARRSGKSPDYEIAGRAACIKSVAGLEHNEATHTSNDAEYLHVLA